MTQNENKTVQTELKTQNIQSVDEKISPALNELKSTPLFKAQASTEHTTQQLVQTKVSGMIKLDEKTPKVKADETLSLLLSGDKSLKTNPALTSDFSVATAKVIASTATTDATKSLESLLRGENTESSSNSKLDGLNTHKADSFEVKINEAKQMIKYLSNDVKTAIEDYKSPFTRVKIQLNPQKLGEVDVTIVQRGKNLHVNLNSNNTAINTLALNANELRTQLNNSGINNATLNFNNSSQNGESNSSNQQQNRHNERRADEEYNYFDNEEQNEEVLSSLEIIVPNYA
jgi:flagellar hook-length control protein FliK